MKSYVASPYTELLTRTGFNSFSRFWELPRNWVEDPNRRREGWSGASFHTISDTETGDTLSVFVKRQENHNYKTLFHPIRGMPTFFREFRSIRYMEKISVPTPELVFYGHRMQADIVQSVLTTVALVGYRELDSLFTDSSLENSLRQKILHRIAEIVWLMHDGGRQHRHLNGKHILVKLGERDTIDVRLIDLEQTKRILQPDRAMARDLEKFVRHTPTLSPDERSEFVRHYTEHLKPELRKSFSVLLKQRILGKWPDSDLLIRM